MGRFVPSKHVRPAAMAIEGLPTNRFRLERDLPPATRGVTSPFFVSFCECFFFDLSLVLSVRRFQGELHGCIDSLLLLIALFGRWYLVLNNTFRNFSLLSSRHHKRFFLFFRLHATSVLV